MKSNVGQNVPSKRAREMVGVPGDVVGDMVVLGGSERSDSAHGPHGDGIIESLPDDDQGG